MQSGSSKWHVMVEDNLSAKKNLTKHQTTEVKRQEEERGTLRKGLRREGRNGKAMGRRIEFCHKRMCSLEMEKKCISIEVRAYRKKRKPISNIRYCV